MGAGSVVDNFVFGVCQGFDIYLGVWSTVHHEGNIQIGKVTVILDHADFFADTFFCRSAVYRDGTRL